MPLPMNWPNDFDAQTFQRGVQSTDDEYISLTPNGVQETSIDYYIDLGGRRGAQTAPPVTPGPTTEYSNSSTMSVVESGNYSTSNNISNGINSTTIQSNSGTTHFSSQSNSGTTHSSIQSNSGATHSSSQSNSGATHSSSQSNSGTTHSSSQSAIGGLNHLIETATS